jgi:hypothetical protein
LAVNSRKDLKAFSAASIASAVSSLPMSGTLPITSRVEGLITSNVLPDLACTHCPSMKADRFIMLVTILDLDNKNND